MEDNKDKRKSSGSSELQNLVNDYMKELLGEVILSENKGRKIKELREALGITQENMAELMHLRRETISRIEGGVIAPTLNFVEGFCRIIAEMKAFREFSAVCEKSNKPRGFANVIFKASFPEREDEIEEIIEIATKSYEKKKEKILRRL